MASLTRSSARPTRPAPGGRSCRPPRGGLLLGSACGSPSHLPVDAPHQVRERNALGGELLLLLGGLPIFLALRGARFGEELVGGVEDRVRGLRGDVVEQLSEVAEPGRDLL